MFPIRLAPYDNGHFVRSPGGALQKAFHHHRPQGRPWYAFGITIHSPTQITFHIHGMACPISGGLGCENFQFSAVVDPSVTAEAMHHLAREMALERRARELADAEEIIIANYAEEILSQCPIT